MKLCMFSPVEMDLERGWPGRVDGDTVDPARGADAAVVLHRRRRRARARRVSARGRRLPRAGASPAVGADLRRADDFRFANPAAIVGADPEIAVLDAVPVERVAAVIGLDGAIGGFTPLVEWTAPQLPGEKSRDFALALGPFVTTPDEETPSGHDWEQLVAYAAQNTRLYPGDLIAA